ncbi:hypothetical protein PYCC9005_000434 [Savitreella phatthalungensis]
MLSRTCLRCTRTSSVHLNASVGVVASRRTLLSVGVIERRHTSSTTSTLSESATPDASDVPVEAMTRRRASKTMRYQLHAGLIVSRPPVITRQLEPFEEAYYGYQRLLRSRLASPFPQDFYFQKGSLASKRWTAGGAMRDDRLRREGLTHAASTDAQAELQHIGPGTELTTEERELQDEARLAAELARPRTTEADRANDRTSLDRQLHRTLYMLVDRAADGREVREEESGWRFPQTHLGVGETLHGGAERAVGMTCGKDLKYWMVARHPVGHHAYEYATPRADHPGAKVFWLKARALAGKPVPAKQAGVNAVAWLTREEIQQTVSEEYWAAIEELLPTI